MTRYQTIDTLTGEIVAREHKTVRRRYPRKWYETHEGHIAIAAALAFIFGLCCR